MSDAREERIQIHTRNVKSLPRMLFRINVRLSRRRRFSLRWPQTEVGSSLSSDIYIYKISELVIIEALGDLGALGLGT